MSKHLLLSSPNLKTWPISLDSFIKGLDSFLNLAQLIGAHAKNPNLRFFGSLLMAFSAFKAHNNGTGAKYTRGRGPVRLLAQQAFDNRSEAS
ncbi:MAG: hypothetical protein ACKOXZ_02945, partial [Polynucleobacter victoriensis]